MPRNYILFFVGFVLLVAYCEARTRWFELERYSFADFEKEYNRVYASVEERQMRRELFETRLHEIRMHNRDERFTWKRGINQFSDRTEEEFKQVLGVRKELIYQSRAHESHIHQLPTPERMLANLPDSIDWREKYPSIVTPVKDQGQCGSCWSFAAAQSIESAWAIATGQLAILSEQNILSCTPNPQQCGGTGGCQGATAEIAFQQIINAGGIASEWTYPYISYHGSNYECSASRFKTPIVANISSYVQLPANQYSPLMNAIASQGPIAVSVDASAWSSYEEGVFNGCNQTNPVINHAVQLVGYGTDNGNDYWLIRNSWSPSWGENGYIRIYRTSAPQCGTDLNPLDGTGCVGGPSSVTVCGTCGVLYDSSYPVV